jgi:X-Pro dipeptidyl-peptidase
MRIPNKMFAAFLLIALTAFFIPAEAQEAASRAVPVFEDGQAQIVPCFSNEEDWIIHDLWVQTEFDTDGDGKSDRMHVSVTRPAQTETEGLKLPVIYITSPYFAGTGSLGNDYFWDVRHELDEIPPARTPMPPVQRRGERPVISKSQIDIWVPRGYVVVHSSSPGTGLSDGSPTVGGRNESLAPKAVIDWLNGRAPGFTSRDGDERVEAYWSTGKVGMTGTSYNGTLPIAAATTGVEGLEAIIPVAPNTSYFLYYRSYGLVRHPGGYLGEDIDVLYDFINSGDESKRAYADSVIRDTKFAQNMHRHTGDLNDFWVSRDYLNQMDDFRAPLLMSHGFNDWNVMPEHSLRIYEAAKEKGVPAQIFYHQGGHGGPPPIEMMNKWFTRYLHGIENGVENDPRAWIVREKDDMDKPTPYEDYPNPDASPVKFFLSPGAPERGGLVLSPVYGRKRETLVDNVSFDGDALARAEHTNHRLIYVTPELKEDVHISGRPSITIKAASSKPAVNLSVWMVSLPWNEGRRVRINDNIINRGWADLRNHKCLRNGEPLKPGKFYEMTFYLEPDDQIIPKGQQIGLMIFSSDREYTLWPAPGTELTVDLSGTSISIPIVGGLEAYQKAAGK